MRKFCIKTLGCKVNQYESQVIRERFIKDGCMEVESLDDADIFVVNTCTVTSNSDTKSLRLLRKAMKKDKCVVVTGCMVEDRELDLSKLSGARFIIKNKDKYKIPEIIDKGEKKASRESFKISAFKGHTRVFVKIQDGCNNVCSFCKVRIVRGRAKSRPFKDILGECLTLIKNGTKEIVLTGICLGSYGKDLLERMNLSGLIQEICKIEGDWRLRLSSIEPKDIDKTLIQQLLTEPRLCKHLHIPFQAGDTYILKKMDRPYRQEDYLNIVSKLRDVISDIAITTDIMVGFPGEKEANFHNTVDFLNIVRPMRMHVFPYSGRKGTKAYSYRDGVSNVVKKRREDKLLFLAKEFSSEFKEKFLDKEIDVLVEDKRTKDSYLQGYTDRYIKVLIDGPEKLKGKIIKLKNTVVEGPLKA